MTSTSKSVLIVIVLFLGVLGGMVYSEAKYTRQECIQKVSLDWSNFTSAEIETTISEIAASIDTEAFPIGGFAFPWKAREELYLQFTESCEDKDRLAKELIETSVSPNVARMPPYWISDEVVVPNASTISLRGPNWKDDEFQ
jgi:hypothetical protein